MNLSRIKDEDLLNRVETRRCDAASKYFSFVGAEAYSRLLAARGYRAAASTPERLAALRGHYAFCLRWCRRVARIGMQCP